MKIGKIDEAAFRSLIQGKFGRRDPSVIVPPRTGVDAGVVDLGLNCPPNCSASVRIRPRFSRITSLGGRPALDSCGITIHRTM
jgi:hypothetical protein